VWMIADGWAGRSYDTVREALVTEYKKRAGAEMPGDTQADLVNKLRQKHPGLSEELLQRETEDYLRNRLDQRIADQAKEDATMELNGFIHSARPLLERCASEPFGMRFFQTAP